MPPRPDGVRIGAGHAASPCVAGAVACSCWKHTRAESPFPLGQAVLTPDITGTEMHALVSDRVCMSEHTGTLEALLLIGACQGQSYHEGPGPRQPGPKLEPAWLTGHKHADILGK